MKKVLLATVLGLCTAGYASAQSMSTTTTTMANDKDGKPMPSPRMATTAKVGGTEITIDYGAPSLRSRELSTLVPTGKVWRAGANEATSLKLSGPLMIGSLNLTAGSYTLYVNAKGSGWELIVNKQTGQWGTVYKQDMDLGRTPMKVSKLGSPAEVMSYSVEKIHGKQGELHLKWGTVDASVPVMVM